MDIKILQLLEGARRATGLTVVIDVFRAFSVACYVFDNGARRIITVGELETAYQLKRENPDCVLIGERGGQRPAGFDFGNSPAEIELVDFTNRVVVQTTSAGTQGLVNVQHASEIITGSFVNAPAVVRYIKARKPRAVSLVCMGRETLAPSDEDTLCAQFIKDSLEGRDTDFEGVRSYLRGYEASLKFFDPEKTWAPARDFDLCLDLGRFGFVLKAETGESPSTALRKNEVAAV